MHALPQLPQFAWSLLVSTHAPLQGVSPVAHVAEHTPRLHTWPPGQTVPHIPQLVGAVASTAQVPLQSTVYAGQPQFPPLQSSVGPHAVRQPPQCAGSLDVSTHAPLHSVSPIEHIAAHMPRLQKGVGAAQT